MAFGWEAEKGKFILVRQTKSDRFLLDSPNQMVSILLHHLQKRKKQALKKNGQTRVGFTAFNLLMYDC